MKEVLQKIIAESGLASRREATKIIQDGSVKINGKLATLGDRADINNDIITIKGKLLPKKMAKIYIKLNKPSGYTCTNRSFPGEKNIFQLINLPERLFSIGRLDKESRGLIILTNDGNLAQQLAHPRYSHEKIYEVQVSYRNKPKAEAYDSSIINESDSKEIIKNFMRGVNIGDGDGIVQVAKMKYLQNNTFIISLNEGKKRQLRRMFAFFNINVIDLKRTSFANLKLENLKEGSWKFLEDSEIKIISQ